ncbi:hypothetical protein PSM36_3015 [Proteiniphilum saccharofermentans]|uniref:Uncharacterized protein n=1 Tax=Proteiniphilum saccharofermentans TaxID=1642647 RepID=A0A1R3TDV6_9BACT|nr:hypothetical protein PSM36_3015 [Proteiniphilum saccharofermentans]
MYREGFHILYLSNILAYPTQQCPNIIHIGQHIALNAFMFKLLYWI